MCGRLLVVAWILAGAAPLVSEERVALQVTPAVAFAPANLLVQTTVAAAEDIRRMVVVAESLDFYRSSELSLDGARGPKVSVIRLRGLPGGQYEVRVVLLDVAGRQLASAQTSVEVVGDR